MTHTILEECTQRASSVFGEQSLCCSARDAAIYLAHTGRGQSLRAIAAVTGTHPSTILRTVRRVEERRDDPLLDRMLDDLEAGLGTERREVPKRSVPACGDIAREARRYLRRLCEPGSFLLVADGSEQAGVFCAANRYRRPIAMFCVDLAAEFLRRDWIRVTRHGQSSVRYGISETGRAFLRRAISEDQGRRADAFAAQHRLEAERTVPDTVDGEPVKRMVNLGESVLGWLAKRPGPDGKPYLTPEEVEAGERLRSDFEGAQMSPGITQDWRKFLTPGDKLAGNPVPSGPAEGPTAARDRVTGALGILGPGLADVALRVCCFLEGLEACERRLGWSARSGKVVLKLALQRLAEHYGLSAFRH
ncbi:MAG: DUF6456 domain-containing protein [Pseudomonadota bacterium]